MPRYVASNLRDTGGGPTLVPQLVSGLFLSCGLKDDAFAHCWGPGTGGLTPSHGSFVQVDTYGNHSCGLRAEGYVSCVGANGAGQTAAPQGEVFVQITTGEPHLRIVSGRNGSMLGESRRRTDHGSSWRKGLRCAHSDGSCPKGRDSYLR